MSVSESIRYLSKLMQMYPDRRMYAVELQAHMEVKHGDPYDDSRWVNEVDRVVYARARREADMKLRLEGA